MKKNQLLLLGVLFCLLSFNASAALDGPSFPPPGGVDYAFVGTSMGDSGGLTIEFQNFAPSAFSELYWGPVGDILARLSVLPTGESAAMQLVMAEGRYAQWQGWAWYYDQQNELRGTPTWLMATIYSASPGYPAWSILPGIGAVVDNSAGLDFSVHLFLQATDSGGNWMPLNSIPHEGSSFSSFTGGFWSAAPVPEPSTCVAAGLLLLPLGLGLLRREKKACDITG